MARMNSTDIISPGAGSKEEALSESSERGAKREGGPRSAVPVWRQPKLAIGLAALVLLVAGALLIPGKSPVPKIPVETPGAFPIALFADETRAAVAAVVSIPPRSKQIEFQCQIPVGSPTGTYRVRLTDSLGHETVVGASRPREEAQDLAYVTAPLTSDRLKAGRYTVSVDPESDPTQTVANYDLTIR
jgi:hypothetical protein